MAVTEVTTIAELRELYPLIELGVSRLSKKGGVGPDRIAADVYHEVINGRVRFFAVHDDDQVWGWGTGYLNGVDAVIEDFFLTTGAPKFLMFEFADHFEKAMQAEGAIKVSFVTQREALGKVMSKSGYTFTCYVFTKELGKNG